MKIRKLTNSQSCNLYTITQEADKIRISLREGSKVPAIKKALLKTGNFKESASPQGLLLDENSKYFKDGMTFSDVCKDVYEVVSAIPDYTVEVVVRDNTLSYTLKGTLPINGLSDESIDSIEFLTKSKLADAANEINQV